MLKTEDLKSPVKDAKKMKTMSCAGSPKTKINILRCFNAMEFCVYIMEHGCSCGCITKLRRLTVFVIIFIESRKTARNGINK